MILKMLGNALIAILFALMMVISWLSPAVVLLLIVWWFNK